MNSIRVILFLTTLMVLFTPGAWSSSGPPLRRQFSFDVTATDLLAANKSIFQAQIVQLDLDVYAVINMEASASIDYFKVSIFSSNWTQSTTYEKPLLGTSVGEFLALSSPDKTVVVITSLTNGLYAGCQIALKIDQQGQMVLYNIFSCNGFGNTEQPGCRVSNNYMAIGQSFSTDVPRLTILDNSLNSVYNMTFQYGKRINMACDGAFLYVLVQSNTGTTSVMRFQSSDWTTPQAYYNTTKLPSTNTPSISVAGEHLIIAITDTTMKMHVLQLTAFELTEVTYAQFNSSGDDYTIRYPSSTNDGYLVFPSKLKTTGSWIEYSAFAHNGTIVPLEVRTTWTADNRQLREAATARYYNDLYGNGYIAVMTDVDKIANKTRNNIMFFGDVCGDGIVSGTTEQCDGGEFCNIRCQCDIGYIPTSPLSNGCVSDTSFAGCGSCTPEASYCDLQIGACVGYRVAPILQCIEERGFGFRRGHFSYRSNHTATILPATSNNVVAPQGTPIGEFELGRSLYYPFSAFVVDFAPGTKVGLWQLDGTVVTFEVSNSLLLCPETLSLLIETNLTSSSDIFTNVLGNTLAQLMNISNDAVLLRTEQSKKRQLGAYFRADIIYDTVNDVAAKDAVQTLFMNQKSVSDLIAEVQRIRIMPLPNEVGEGVIADTDPFPAITWSTDTVPLSPIPSPVSQTPTDVQPSGGDPISQPIDNTVNTPEKKANGGWSNDYIAAIILVPLGVGAAIFLAVYFARKKKKQRMVEKALNNDQEMNNKALAKEQRMKEKALAKEKRMQDKELQMREKALANEQRMSEKSANKKHGRRMSASVELNDTSSTTQLNTPTAEPRTNQSSTYTTVPEVSSNKYGAITSLAPATENKTSTNRLRVPYAEITFKKEIGAGAYGKVFIGEWQRTKVALKINTSATGEDFAREARLMVELRPHPNVVQMLGVSSDGPYPVMILEFCDGGSLDDKLFNMNEVITPQQQLEIVLGIAKGLYHLHKNQIVHRDLAARNILLSRNEPKISDFGLSRQVGDQKKGTTKSNVGPIRWMAPESLKQMVYSTKSDIWMFGIVMFEIVARKEPHSEADQMAIGLEIRDRGATPAVPSECDPVLKEIMSQCWQMDPEKRPTIEQICDILDRYMEEKR